MNPEVFHELTEQAESLAYDAILHSNLWQELTCSEWEALKRQFAAKLVEQVRELVDAEFTRREAESREMDAWLASGPI